MQQFFEIEVMILCLAFHGYLHSIEIILLQHPLDDYFACTLLLQAQIPDSTRLETLFLFKFEMVL
jgi:hypothetical protein